MNAKQDMLSNAEFKAELTGIIPDLRAFARSLCRQSASADDLAQETMLKAWKARKRFARGTNIKAWTFTIMRNQFYSDKRRAWRQTPLDPDVAEATLVANDNPRDCMQLLAVRNALELLPDDQRDALVLVGAGGLSYKEAADVCGCAVGTVKSRVSRARCALVHILDANKAGFSDDEGIKAADVFDDILEKVDELVAQPVEPG